MDAKGGTEKNRLKEHRQDKDWQKQSEEIYETATIF